MSLQYKVILSLVALLAAYSFGHYTKPQPAIATTTTQETEKQLQHDVIVTIKTPDGTTKTVETVDTTTKVQEQKKEVEVTPPKQSKINISALVANDFSRGGILPLYGVSVSKEFLGPVTIGAFGLTNGTIGLSLGINF